MFWDSHYSAQTTTVDHRPAARSTTGGELRKGKTPSPRTARDTANALHGEQRGLGTLTLPQYGYVKSSQRQNDRDDDCTVKTRGTGSQGKPCRSAGPRPGTDAARERWSKPRRLLGDSLAQAARCLTDRVRVGSRPRATYKYSRAIRNVKDFLGARTTTGLFWGGYEFPLRVPAVREQRAAIGRLRIIRPRRNRPAGLWEIQVSGEAQLRRRRQA